MRPFHLILANNLIQNVTNFTVWFALVFWAWLLGGLGAILAIPLTLLIKALLVDIDPKASWAHALMRSTEKVSDPNAPPKVKKSRRHKLEPAPEPPTAV